MRIVLRADVSGLGRKGDVCEVAKGYARNYLVPRGLAIKFSPGAERQASTMRRAAALARAADKADAETIATRLAPTEIMVSAKATKAGHLYGSVTAVDIVSAVENQIGAVIKPKSVALDTPIREIGSQNVLFRLHEEVEVPVTVTVTPE